MEIFCQTIDCLKQRYGLVENMTLMEKKTLQNLFHREVLAWAKRIRVRDCIQKAEELGILRRYRDRKDFLKMIGMFLLRDRVSPQVKKETMRYILLDYEISQLRRFYQQSSCTVSFKNRSRRMIRTIASNIFMIDLRNSLTRLGIPFGFREKETMVDLLGLLWFSVEIVQPTYTIICPAPHEEDCPICTDSLTEHTEAVKLGCACSSLYHKECIDKWATISFSCPTCRQDLLQQQKKR